MIRRLLAALLTLFITTIVVFAMVRFIPGDPIATLLGREYEPEVAASLRNLYGLDEPLIQQYLTWLNAILHGDFGYSLLTRASVSEILIQRIPRTLYLLAGGVIIGLVIAIPIGILGAFHRGKLADTMLMSFTTALMSVPQFWLGILLIVVFAVSLGLLPGAGYVSFSDDPIESIRSMMLPWLTIGFAMAAFIARVLRSSLLDALGQDYIRTAEARGLTNRQVVMKHALRNAAIPTVTVVGLQIGYLLGGSIVVEQVFAFPGMGRVMISSIIQRDYPLIQAGVLFFATGFVIVNLLTDLSYGFLDPRARLDET